jgi:hypothetical protein
MCAWNRVSRRLSRLMRTLHVAVAATRSGSRRHRRKRHRRRPEVEPTGSINKWRRRQGEKGKKMRSGFRSQPQLARAMIVLSLFSLPARRPRHGHHCLLGHTNVTCVACYASSSAFPLEDSPVPLSFPWPRSLGGNRVRQRPFRLVKAQEGLPHLLIFFFTLAYGGWKGRRERAQKDGRAKGDETRRAR